jgi:hypothetical protein
MPYSDEIPLELISDLVAMLEERLERYTIASQLFIIQYSFFEYANDKWVLKNFLDVGDETLNNIYLNIGNVTNFSVYGQNPNYGVLHIRRKLDMRNKSIPGKIYACDLYINFQPEHFIGRCYTSSIKNY